MLDYNVIRNIIAFALTSFIILLSAQNGFLQDQESRSKIYQSTKTHFNYEKHKLHQFDTDTPRSAEISTSSKVRSV